MNFTVKKWQNREYVTLFFLMIQVAVFIIMEWYGMLNGYGLQGTESVAVLNKFGALTQTGILMDHEWWRLITPIFIHIGISHLFFNSLTLYFIGRQLESIIGHARFFIVYMLAGIAGNVISLSFGQLTAISAGASTSLFGLFACYLVLAELFRFNPAVRAIGKNMGLFILMNLLFNFFGSGVDILGHIGGAIGGYLIMNVVSIPKITDGRIITEGVNIHKRIISGAIYVFMLVISLVFVMKKYGIL